MLAENIPIASSPVPIATVNLVQNTMEVMTPAQPEPELLTWKTRHQEEQEDLYKPPWVPSRSPWVTIALAFYEITEMVVMAKTHPPVEVQPLQMRSQQTQEEEQSPPTTQSSRKAIPMGSSPRGVLCP
ncbi:major facilitator superfamily domain-containing protein 6-A-like [Xyrauchen texanus]|uniref:major facilitator superfamily domain-containing protein 6-A-like n=1 Tax=Xyrauchen texanus TaxID=154827 RepID=UPI0022429C1E|nr:major facilitator superfamily domain-containing protein 6-A-like [Xyrauchen texanus]